MRHKPNKYALAIFIAALAVMTIGLSSAQGSASPTPVMPVTTPTDVVQTVTNPNGTTGTLEIKTGTPVQVSGSAAPAIMQTSSTSASTCGIWHNSATQTYSSSLWGIFGHTSQSFEWYYNCNAAWISLRNGYSGYHHCGGGWAIGVSVDVQECTKSNDPAFVSLGTDVKPYYRFKVSALFNGFPVSFTKYMQSCLSPNGGAWSCP